MATKLYVGSLSYGVDDKKLEEFFASAGTVVSANVITDRYSNQSKGFGFVEMSSESEAQEAIKNLNDKELDGRTIKVMEARPAGDRPQNNFKRSNFNRGGSSSNRNRY